MSAGITAIAGQSAMADSGGHKEAFARRDKELREFGLIVGALIAGILGLLLPLLHGRALPLWPWIAAVLLVGAALVRPALLHYFYVVWTRIGAVLGWINTRIILSILFYAVLTPMGFLMRVFGHRPMEPGIDDGSGSYRVPSQKIDRESFERPF